MLEEELAGPSEDVFDTVDAIDALRLSSNGFLCRERGMFEFEAEFIEEVDDDCSFELSSSSLLSVSSSFCTLLPPERTSNWSSSESDIT